MRSFIRKFIPDFTGKSPPLHALTSGTPAELVRKSPQSKIQNPPPSIWNEAREEGLTYFQQALTNSPVLT